MVTFQLNNVNRSTYDKFVQDLQKAHEGGEVASQIKGTRATLSITDATGAKLVIGFDLPQLTAPSASGDKVDLEGLAKKLKGMLNDGGLGSKPKLGGDNQGPKLGDGDTPPQVKTEGLVDLFRIFALLLQVAQKQSEANRQMMAADSQKVQAMAIAQGNERLAAGNKASSEQLTGAIVSGVMCGLSTVMSAVSFGVQIKTMTKPEVKFEGAKLSGVEKQFNSANKIDTKVGLEEKFSAQEQNVLFGRRLDGDKTADELFKGAGVQNQEIKNPEIKPEIKEIKNAENNINNIDNKNQPKLDESMNFPEPHQGEINIDSGDKIVKNEKVKIAVAEENPIKKDEIKLDQPKENKPVKDIKNEEKLDIRSDKNDDSQMIELSEYKSKENLDINRDKGGMGEFELREVKKDENINNVNNLDQSAENKQEADLLNKSFSENDLEINKELMPENEIIKKEPEIPQENNKINLQDENLGIQEEGGVVSQKTINAQKAYEAASDKVNVQQTALDKAKNTQKDALDAYNQNPTTENGKKLEDANNLVKDNEALLDKAKLERAEKAVEFRESLQADIAQYKEDHNVGLKMKLKNKVMKLSEADQTAFDNAEMLDRFQASVDAKLKGPIVDGLAPRVAKFRAEYDAVIDHASKNKWSIFGNASGSLSPLIKQLGDMGMALQQAKVTQTQAQGDAAVKYKEAEQEAARHRLEQDQEAVRAQQDAIRTVLSTLQQILQIEAQSIQQANA